MKGPTGGKPVADVAGGSRVAGGTIRCGSWGSTRRFIAAGESPPAFRYMMCRAHQKGRAAWGLWILAFGSEIRALDRHVRIVTWTVYLGAEGYALSRVTVV